jgi:hypothetical protein
MRDEEGTAGGRMIELDGWRVDVSASGNLFDLSKVNGRGLYLLGRRSVETLFMALGAALGRGIPDDLKDGA